jgi:hypothetical protein
MTMTRSEHLAWAKKRALEYLDHGMVEEGLNSMRSDLDKHEGFRDKAGVALQLLGMQLQLAGQLDTIEQARKWINGFN